MTAVDLRPLEDQERSPLLSADEWRELFADLNDAQARLSKVRELTEPIAFGNPTDDDLRTASDEVYNLIVELGELDGLIEAIETATNNVLRSRGLITYSEELELAELAERQARRDAYTDAGVGD